MATDLVIARDGVRLAVRDHGGLGPPLLLLHGLAGHLGEWNGTAAALAGLARVIAFDARGHGSSTRHPRDVSPGACAADAAAVLRAVASGPAVVAGHSLGGISAMHLAVERPDLVRALVVADAGPGPQDDAEMAGVATWIRSWPVPFRDERAAAAFFGGGPPRAAAWVAGLRESGDGLRPAFDPEVLVSMLRAFSGGQWEVWDRIRCECLVLRAIGGMLGERTAAEMRARRPDVEVAVIDAGHDLHLDRPEDWVAVLRRVLAP